MLTFSHYCYPASQKTDTQKHESGTERPSQRVFLFFLSSLRRNHALKSEQDSCPVSEFITITNVIPVFFFFFFFFDHEPRHGHEIERTRSRMVLWVSWHDARLGPLPRPRLLRVCSGLDLSFQRRPPFHGFHPCPRSKSGRWSRLQCKTQIRVYLNKQIDLLCQNLTVCMYNFILGCMQI